MKPLKTYIYESIFDEEDQLEDVERTAEGINGALRDMKQNSRLFKLSTFADIIRNITPHSRFGKIYRDAIKKGCDAAESVLLIPCLRLFDNKCDSFLKMFNKILYNHLDEVFVYASTDHIAGFGPMLRKAPLHKFDKYDLDKRQLNNYEDAEALLAWAPALAPSSNYMIKIPKNLNKFETELMVELVKLLYKNE